MTKATRKVLCAEYKCGWHGIQAEILQTPSPFDASDILQGCPLCKSVNTIRYACDEPDCWREATCGAPTETGYRQTCGQHMPRRNEFG